MRYFTVLSLICFGFELLVFAQERTKYPQVEVPGGTFLVGCSENDHLCDDDEGPEGGVAVDVPAFMIDIQETSVAEYRECVEAGVCTKPFDFRRVHYCSYDAPQRDDYPVNCVDWQQALNYCQWRGGRLAYEVEWEKAARAGTSTPYFWGEERSNCKRAVMDPGQPGESDFETDGCWRDLSWPRNSFPPNPLGLFDVIGGTSEWVMDWYDPEVHEKYFRRGKLTGPDKGSEKTIKAGSWDEKHWAQRVSNRFHKPITGNPDLYGSNGIRCVNEIDPQS
ncbi:MAG: SUMF1/EgtB/PvdO family nonheme iron enzyme [Pseudomonadota bacterium]